jgi:rubrerythrin
VQHKAAAEEDTENIEDRAMQSSFAQSARVQQMHLPLKKKLDRNPEKGYSIHVCSFGGFISMVEKAPEHCPICTAAAHRFIMT